MIQIAKTLIIIGRLEVIFSSKLFPYSGVKRMVLIVHSIIMIVISQGHVLLLMTQMAMAILRARATATTVTPASILAHTSIAAPKTEIAIISTILKSRVATPIPRLSLMSMATV